MNAIYNYHKDKSDQFNLKWFGMLKIEIILLIILLCSNNSNVLLLTCIANNYVYNSGSQENLDELDKADIAVCTKVPELIECLCCVLLIYMDKSRVVSLL